MNPSGPLLPTVKPSDTSTSNTDITNDNEVSNPTQISLSQKSISPLPIDAHDTQNLCNSVSSCFTEMSNEGVPKTKCSELRLSPPGKDCIESVVDASLSGQSWQMSEPKHSHHDIFQDEGGGDGPALVYSDEDPEPRYSCQSPSSWPNSLHQLLRDAAGSTVFIDFVYKKTGSRKMIDFWYACNGLHKEKDPDELISLIWKNFLRNYQVKVTRNTHQLIEEAMERREFTKNIFDRAQKEVEQIMNQTLYPCFLESNEYISWLFEHKQEDSPPSPYGATNDPYASSMLPTVHENTEFDMSAKPRLTSDNLLLAANYRAVKGGGNEDIPEAFYLKAQTLGASPYHCFPTGHAVSLQDSEIQSMSSGAHTDETLSCTSSARSHHRKRPSKHFHRLREVEEAARQNPIESPLIAAALANTYVIPRTMRTNRKNMSNSGVDPKALAKKLALVQQNQEADEKFKQSLCKIAHNDETSDEAKREHAVNSLPPSELVNRLVEKTVPLDDQSILDDHVARVWDSPNTPGSPKQASKSPPTKGGKVFSRQFPVLNLTPSTSNAPKSPSKHMRYVGSLISSSHRNSFPWRNFPSTSSQGAYPYLPDEAVYGNRVGHQQRRTERGQDVYSTFSSDSGNVADYHEQYEMLNSSSNHLSKSKSMPEYMEEHQIGLSSDSGIPGSRRQYAAMRRSARRPATEPTDSGVSVVSDTPPPADYSERITNYMTQFAQGDNLTNKLATTRSVHNVVRPTSPGAQRRSGNSGRRTQGSSSLNSFINMKPSTMDIPHQYSYEQASYSDLSRQTHLNLAQHSSYANTEKRKNRCGNFNRSYSTSSVLGDGSSSNGSTLKKQQKTSQHEFVSVPSGSRVTSAASQPPNFTQIIYNFSEKEVPYITKVAMSEVTLKKYKQHLPKKGNYRFYFKKKCEDISGIEVVYEEISDDSEVLPLFQGKIFSQIRKDE